MFSTLQGLPARSRFPRRILGAAAAALLSFPAPGADETAGPSGESWDEVLRARRGWWSLEPARRRDPPAVRDAAWSDHPVDRFLLAKLEEAGLAPAGAADPRTLARRLSLVLTGLLPRPEEVEELVEGRSTVEQAVDRLLASAHFGERWARHWMDVVRFTETHGNEWNYEVHHAWRYRDYLIRAFNEDLPYDHLVREHIAGDLLPRLRWNRREGFNESVIGTAFYRFGEVNHDDCIGLRQIGFDLADNQIDTLTKAFQATTVACARCHDHKLDAVSMKDYYALLGILRSSRLVAHTIDAPEVNAASLRRLRELKAEIRVELGTVWLREARDVGRYLLLARAGLSGRPAATEGAPGLDARRLEAWAMALKEEKQPLEDPLSPWRTLAALQAEEGAAFAAEWKRLAGSYQAEDRRRAEVNEKEFVVFADFRSGGFAGWDAGGHGLREGPGRSGDFVLSREGDALVQAVLPAGCFTHALSEKLNGTLRSPVLPAGKKQISFEVMGRRSSAVRLVSNNCQLNYKNYRALTSERLQWVTFSPPEDRESLRAYAELMTMLDNPKFPDQLAALGGDKENYRLPFEKAAADSRSFFGVTRVVLHDGPLPPPAWLDHLRALWAEPAPATLAEAAARTAAVVESAVQSWAAGRAADGDALWLDALLRHGLLANSVHLTPRLETLAAEYHAVAGGLATPRVVPGLSDSGPGFEQPLLLRGDWSKPGDAVPRRFLEVLPGPAEPFSRAGSGRVELAERIASPSNPLTARVMVNRIWHHLFGRGLAPTTDDFGRVGEAPSHPELLDDLAARFVEDGWSVKRLIRFLVLTRAFRMSSTPPPGARQVDPRNRLLHHYPARRMEAEAIRDAILAASGRLDLAMYGPSIQPYRESENADRRLFPGPLDGAGRRSIYIKQNLMEGPKFLCAFDFPGGKVTQGRRDVTNVPAQALALLNDPFVTQQARVWGQRLAARPDATVAARVGGMFHAGLGRPPRPGEERRFEETVRELAALHGAAAGDTLKSIEVWSDIAHVLFNLKEFTSIP